MAPRNDATLAFERIEVRKAPGIHPGFTIDGLSPDINIVFGPNASGKSTTARAIQALLWPHPSTLRRHELAASFRLGDDEWTIEADPGRTRRERNGEPADPPLLAPIDDRLRYTLGLPDLLASENQPLAQAIFKESTGGFDLEAIRRQQGYTPTAPPRLETARDVETAQLRLRDTERAAGEVAGHQRQLATLRERERRARQAGAEAENFRRALRFAHARRELDRAGEALGQFAPAMARLTGTEPEELAGIRRQRDALATRRAKLETDLNAAEADRERTGLVDKASPASGEGDPGGWVLSESMIRTLRGQVETIDRLDGEITKLQRDVQGAIAERDAARKRLAVDMSEQQLAALDTAGIRELAALSHDYATLRTQRQAREELERWLGTTRAPEPGVIEELERGIGLLVDRLRTPSEAELDDLLAKARVAGVIGGGLVVAAAIWLGIFVHPAWFLFAMLGILLLLFTWRGTAPPTAAEAARLEREYTATQLPQPRQWNGAGIAALLGELEEDLGVKLVERKKAGRWQDLESHRAELAQKEAEANARRDTLVAKYGVAPDLGEESLRLLAENLSRWQAADGRARAMQANLNAIGQERRNVEARVRDQLARFGYASGTFGPNIDELEERLGHYTEATGRASAARRELEGDVLPELQRLDGATSAIYRRLDLDEGDDHGLDALLRKREAWQAAVAEHRDREHEARAADEALALAPDLKALDPDTAQRRLEAAEADAADLEPVLREIGDIQTRVNDAKRRRDQEDALLRRDDALQALRDDREAAERRAAGDTLLGFVRERTRDAALPLVFHRARELFTIITRGRYELQFEEGPPPAFTARDTATGHTLALDQLSSGTRVQLLMAIRLAFVENVERGPKLPILLDETLGNSDELRAGAIIDAAIEISRNGRQVFYFTAQGDEVARWQARLEQIPLAERPKTTIVDLGEVRQDAGIERLPIQRPEEVIARVAVPAPNGQGRDAYGAALRVPGIDPWTGTLGGVHLWHAITDADALHGLVRQDLRTWGQLAGLAETGAGSTLAVMGVDEETYERAAARMRVLQAALETWRIGRSRPVTNNDLAESGEVPSQAMPAMADLLAEAGGGGEALVTLLQDRSVPGMDAGAVDRLETWLHEHGYIATATPLDRDELRRRVLVEARADLEAGRLAVDDIDELLGQLPA